MTQTITRTIYGAKLQTASLLGRAYQADTNSTLNEAYNVGVSETIDDPDKYPAMAWYGIGYGGHYHTVSADNIPATAPIKHRTRDANFFAAVPFLMRAVDDDLSQAERANYAMRTRETFGGSDYYCYYLKALDLDSTNPEMIRTVTDGETSTNTPFVPEVGDLNPTPPTVDQTATGEFYSVAATLNIVFSETDVAELRNVFDIRFNDPDIAVISEIGLVVAHNQPMDIDVNGTPLLNNFVEAIRAQIVNHITSYYPASYAQRGFEIRLDAGATQAAFGDLDTVNGG